MALRLTWVVHGAWLQFVVRCWVVCCGQSTQGHCVLGGDLPTPIADHDDGPEALEMALCLASELLAGRQQSDGLGNRRPVGGD